MAKGKRNPTLNPQMTRVIRSLEKQGCRVAGGKHPKVYPPNGKPMFVLSGSPGRGRAMENTRAMIRRAGLEI